ncbi:MgtC/SapB family protein [Neptunicella sp. SCSIO 80796]|uniref:MgtC/SapB family protein n=1 Tax=Neptunicella plasticusilytica TaxID=3117012 RepID=UPI003A4DFF67
MDIIQLVDLAPYDWVSILTAIFCGGIIGFERQLRGKPVGIRTSALITLGTYLFLATTFLLSSDHIDPSRVIGQVITGIGFLGAGVMMNKDGAVAGVTSAAAIWILAAIGVIISVGHLMAAIKLSVLVVAILYGVDLLEKNIKALGRGVHAKIKRYSRSASRD